MIPPLRANRASTGRKDKVVAHTKPKPPSRLETVIARLDETAELAAETYQQRIMMYKGSEQSKALAMRFCMEFETDLMALGFTYQSDTLGIAKAVWSCNNIHVVQDAISLFNKMGIALDPEEPGVDTCIYYAQCDQKIPRFGGPTQIRVAAYSNGTATVSATFSFFGL